MPEPTKRTRSEAQEGAGRKAAATLKKRLDAERAEAVASGTPAPLTPAQKAVQTKKQREAGVTKEPAPAPRPVVTAAPAPAPKPTPAPTPVRLSAAPETAMRAAFEKAGLDTRRAELDQLVKGLLSRNKNSPAAILSGFDTIILRRRDLRELIMLDYATKVAGDLGLVETDIPTVSADETSNTIPAVPAKREKRPAMHTRSEEQKASVREANFEIAVWSRKVGDRPLGELTWGELATLQSDCVARAGDAVRTGIYCAADAILLRKIRQHAQVTDLSTRVRDVVSTEVLRKLNREAALEAPKVVEVGRLAYEGTLVNQIEHY
jgi:hypothetical protein